VLILTLLVLAYFFAGLSFALYNDGDLVLETAGRVIGLTFVVLTFPFWASKVAYSWYLGRSA
jgi:hypothetical protein